MAVSFTARLTGAGRLRFSRRRAAIQLALPAAGQQSQPDRSGKALRKPTPSPRLGAPTSKST